MTTALLSLPIFRAFDSAGLPLAGGLLYSYAANTLTPQNTYSDNAGSSPNTNPVVLDSTGSAVVRLDPTLVYKFVLKTSAGTTLWTTDYYQADNLTANSIGQILYPQTAAEIAAGVTPTNYGYAPGDVRRYGAVGDGSTDDRAALQSAINVAAQNNGTVLLDSATYLVSSSGNVVPGGSGNYCLLLASGVTITGRSRQSTIKCTTDAVTILCAAGSSSASHITDVVIDGIQIQAGDSTNNGVGRGILLFRADRCAIRNCEIVGSRLGIQVDRVSSDSAYNVGIQITNNVVRNSFGTTTGNGSGIFVSGADGFQVTGNQCLSIAEHGIYISQNVRNGNVSGNNLVPANNTNLNCGIQVYTSANPPDIAGLTIDSNTCSGGKYGILISCGTPYIIQCSLTANRISGVLTAGMLISNTRESSITGNIVSGTTSGCGIECDLGRSLTLTGNTVSGNGTSGIQFFTTTDSTIVGNHVFNNDQLNSTNYGIRIASTSTGIRMLGNHCTDYQGSPTQKYGIQLDSNCTGCEIAYNNTTGNATGEILDGVASTLATRTLIRSRSTATYQEVLAPAGQDVQMGRALVALGGGAAPTLGTIGGSGPSTAAQNTWMRWVDSTGASCYVPVWK